MNTDHVKDRQSFIEFIHQLRASFLKEEAHWENKTLDDYLNAMAAYAEDIQGYYNNTGQNTDANKPSWKTFADILAGAGVYE